MFIQKNKSQVIFSQQAGFNAQLFDPQYLKQDNKIIGSSIGRGTTWFFKVQNSRYVLRHYFRGGLIGRVNPDLFLYTGLQSTRAYQEFSLLEKMDQLKLPVPQVIAGKISRGFFFYQADLIIGLIDGAVDLVHLLMQAPLTQKQWLNVGHVICEFHHHNIYHSDMNSHNIMIDKQDKVWMIDFDKCAQRQDGEWKAQTLARLLRSLNKEKLKNKHFHWQESDWKTLLKGYTHVVNQNTLFSR